MAVLLASSAPDTLPVGRVNQPYLLGIALSAALGGLLFGYDFSVISGGIEQIRTYFGVGALGEGFLGASLYIGCILGALVAGTAADRFGRRPLLVLSALFFGASCLGTGFAHTLPLFIGFRLVGGLGVGIASIVSPLYIAEIAPGHLRGRMVSINQLAIVVGILLTYFSNYYLLQRFGPGAWRWMLGVGTVPSGLFGLAALLIPESPRWLLTRGLTDRAGRVLRRMGDEVYATAQLQRIDPPADPTDRPTFRDLLAPSLRPVLTIGIVLAVFQQWCGINNIFTYAPRIFAAAGYDDKEGLWQTVIIGAVNLLVTILTMALVDRLGRRKLLLFGSLGLAVIYALLGLFFYQNSQNGPLLLTLILSAIGVYGVSLAPVTWVVNAEIFPNRVRGQALSFATLFLWLACFLLIQTFPWLFARLNGAWLFWLFALICAAGFVFILRRVPETKGQSLEALEQTLMGR